INRFSAGHRVAVRRGLRGSTSDEQQHESATKTTTSGQISRPGVGCKLERKPPGGGFLEILSLVSICFYVPAFSPNASDILRTNTRRTFLRGVRHIFIAL